MSVPVTMYTSAICPFCVRAEQLLARHNVTNLEKIRVDLHPELRARMIKLTGQRTVPQIFIGDYHVGGCDELYELNHEGRLEALLAGDPA